MLLTCVLKPPVRSFGRIQSLQIFLWYFVAVVVVVVGVTFERLAVMLLCVSRHSTHFLMLFNHLPSVETHKM